MSRCLNLVLTTAIAVLPLPAIAQDFEEADNPWVADAAKFSCPSTVKLGDKIVLGKKAGNWPDQLGVKLPNGDFVGLVEDDAQPPVRQLMSRKALGAARIVEIPSDPKVFKKLGTYQFLLSGNLESDEGGYICKTKIIAAK